MKILHISMNANYTEGYGYQDNLLPLYQAKLGHEVHIITSVLSHGKDGIEEVAECEYVNDGGVHVYRRKAKGAFSKVRKILGIYNFKKDIKSIEPDIIMIHGLCNLLLKQVIDYKSNINSKCHIIMDNHQDGNTTKINNIVLKMARKIHKEYLRKYISEVYKVYGVTSWRVDYARDEYGIPADKLDLLLMGYDTDKMHFEDYEEVKNTIRRNLNITDEDFVLITGGKLAKNKNIIEVLSAFNKIADEHIKFIVFGPVYEDVSEEFFKLVSKDKRIRYIGEIPSEQICNYYFASDLGVFPGRHSVIWEQAVGAGLPCIFRSYGENTHLEVGGNCILLDKYDEDAIYDSIMLCINDKEIYEKMKNAAIENGRRSFSYYEIAKKSLECIREEEN